MKAYIFSFILIPLISSSQIGIGLSGHSHFTTGQAILPLNSELFGVSDYEMRINSISLDWSTGRKFVLGEIWCVVAMTYQTNKTFHEFSPDTPNLFNYKFIERRLVPSLALQYVLMRTDFFRIYSSLGSYAVFENLNLDYESNLDIEMLVHDYNSIIPFIRLGVQLNMGRLTINPFVSCEAKNIYFDKLGEISKETLKESLKSAQIRTGLRFGILF